MNANMNSDSMVVLTKYGIQILNNKSPMLKAIPNFNDNLQTIKSGDKTILRTSLRTLFMIFGDQLTRKGKFKRVFVSDALNIEQGPAKPKQQPDTNPPKLVRRQTPPPSRKLDVVPSISTRDIARYNKAMGRTPPVVHETKEKHK